MVRFRNTHHALFWLILLSGGCVERTLRINTEPEGGVVWLNDEEVGVAPVAVSFQWYGDYAVRISREGYETLETHCRLDPPWYDYFPFDFFAQVLYPGRIEDSYEWSFVLEPARPVHRDALIERARLLEQRFRSETESPTEDDPDTRR